MIINPDFSFLFARRNFMAQYFYNYHQISLASQCACGVPHICYCVDLNNFSSSKAAIL